MEQRSRAVFVAGGQSGAEGPAAAPVSAPAEEEEDREAAVTLQSIVKGWTQKNTSDRRWDSCDRESHISLTYKLFWDSECLIPITKNQQPQPERGRPCLHQAQPSHPMDFKANLKGIKAKTEEVRKGNSTQQMDFRAVLGKKGDKPATKPSDMLTKTDTDFRSVLTNKKNLASPEKNGENETKAVHNCMNEGFNEKMSSNRVAGKVPQFVEKLDDLTVLDGQRLRLQCRLTTTDLTGITVTWTLDGKVIKPSKFIILTNEGQRSYRPKQNTLIQ